MRLPDMIADPPMTVVDATFTFASGAIIYDQTPRGCTQKRDTENATYTT